MWEAMTISAKTLEDTVSEHTLQIKELEDRVEYKHEKIQQILDKIDLLTQEVQKLQLASIKDDNKISERVTRLENTQATLKWITGIGLTALTVAISLISLFITLV